MATKPVGGSLLPCCRPQQQATPWTLQLLHGSLRRDYRLGSIVGPHGLHLGPDCWAVRQLAEA